MKNIFLVLGACVLLCFLSACGNDLVTDGTTTGGGGTGTGGGTPPPPPTGGGTGGGGTGGGGATTLTSLSVTGAGFTISNGSVTDLPTVAPTDAAVSYTFFITNGGTTDITLTGSPLVVVAGSAGFTVSSQPSTAVVLANSAGSLAFDLTFTPSVVGTQTTVATLTDGTGTFTFTFNIPVVQGLAPEISVLGKLTQADIQTDASNSPLLANETEFGKVPYGSTKIIEYEIKNTGQAELNLTDLVGSSRLDIIGLDAGNFKLVLEPESVIAPGTSTFFKIALSPGFAPATPVKTEYVAQILMQSDDLDETAIVIDLRGEPYTPSLTITGNGAAVPHLQTMAIEANTTNFGATAVGASIAYEFTMTNKGTTELSIGSVFISGPVGSDGKAVYRLDSPPGSSVLAAAVIDPAGIIPPVYATTTFTVSFHPHTYGEIPASISIVNGDAPVSPFLFNISGTGLAAAIEVTGNGVSIANGDLDPSGLDDTDYSPDGAALMKGRDQLTKTFTLTNIGNATLTFDDNEVVQLQQNDILPVIQAGLAEWELVSVTPWVSFLLPGESLEFAIVAKPFKEGRFERTVVIPVFGTVGDANFQFAISKFISIPTLDVRGKGVTVSPGNIPEARYFTDFGDVDAGRWAKFFNPNPPGDDTGTRVQVESMEKSYTMFLHNVTTKLNHPLDIRAIRGQLYSKDDVDYGYKQGKYPSPFRDFVTPIDILDSDTLPTNVFPVPNIGALDHNRFPGNYLKTVGTGVPVRALIDSNPNMKLYDKYVKGIQNVIEFETRQDDIREGDTIIFKELTRKVEVNKVVLSSFTSQSEELFTVDAVDNNGMWVTVKESLGALGSSNMEGSIYIIGVDTTAKTFQFPGGSSSLFDTLVVGDILKIYTTGAKGGAQVNVGSHTITALDRGTRRVTVAASTLVALPTVVYGAKSRDSESRTISFDPSDLSRIEVGSKISIGGTTYTVASVDDANDTIVTEEPLDTFVGSFNVTATIAQHMSASIPENVFVIKRDFEITQQPQQTTLDTGEFTSYTLRFRPRPRSVATGDVVKTFNQRINVPHSGKKPTEWTYNVTGRTVFPVIRVNPEAGSLGYPGLTIGSKASVTYVVENIAVGGNDLTLTFPADYVTIAGPNAADFTLKSVSITDATINPGETGQTFTIEFSPLSTGKRTAVLLIANNDGKTGGTYSIAIEAVGLEVAPLIAPSAAGMMSGASR